MNSLNASTGFSNFQLRLGRLPQIIPPLVPTTLHTTPTDNKNSMCACEMISKMHTNISETKDNLFMAKISQAHQANVHRAADPPFKIGDKVMLSTLHHHQEFKKKGEKRAAKFFPRYDGPYDIIDKHSATSNYTLELPNNPNTYPTFHASELKAFRPNDPDLFPHHELTQPQPILTTDGLEEYHVEEIIDSCRRGHGWQYLVRWSGYGPEHDRWLTGSSLEECKALDVWLKIQDRDSATR